MTSDDTRPLTSDLGFEDEPDREPATTPPATDPQPPADPYGGPVTYRKGPAPFAVVLGVVGLVVAGAVLVTEAVDVSLPWDDLGPWAVVAGGLVVVLVGLLGLRANRAQD